jgi:hypothetical protein
MGRDAPRETGRRLRGRSKQLFGNADRLQVAAAVARTSSGVVHAQELSNRLGISPPRVRTQLLAFVAADLMIALPREGNIQSYERVDDEFWDMAAGLVDRWGDDG